MGVRAPDLAVLSTIIDTELRERHVHHKLRIIVSLGIEVQHAEVKVSGCLTADSCAALVPVIRRASPLGFSVHVNLLSSRHIDQEALTQLQDGTILAAVRSTTTGRGIYIHDFTVMAPFTLPVCPTLLPANSCGLAVPA